MAGRFGRSMQLLSASWSVLRENSRLLVFPVVSMIAGAAVVAVFAVPVLLEFTTFTTTVDEFGVEQTSFTMSPVGWVLTGIGYFTSMYVGTFMNAALVVAANERLTGTGPATVSSGLRGAAARAGALFWWVLVAATVGWVLRMLEERLGIVGRVVIGLVGIAWSLLTFLVVPVVVLEDNSTGKAIGRSVTMFRTTWGENLIANAGFGIFGVLIVLSGGALFFVGVLTGTVEGMVLMGVIAVLWILVLSQVVAAMTGIYRVALYRYAVDGRPPVAFRHFDFAGAFRTKNPRFAMSQGPALPGFTTDPARTREAWRKWEPPAPEQVDGAFGIEIPGAPTPPGAPVQTAPPDAASAGPVPSGPARPGAAFPGPVPSGPTPPGAASPGPGPGPAQPAPGPTSAPPGSRPPSGGPTPPGSPAPGGAPF